MAARYDFEITVNLREDTPDDVLRVVEFLMTEESREPANLPDDEFFSNDWDWRAYRFVKWVTECDPHAGDAICSFRRAYRFSRSGVDHYQYALHLRCSEKLETIFEVVLPFAMWIAKWSDQNEWVGNYKEESSRHPTLLYIHGGELYRREVSEPPQRASDGAIWK